ncbi:unnamed protein product [Protopolystoma xenopodis]|uniref:Exoribonuclease phosphorolytic domain-containing protein n=1 Tax=Protopolystoma xenopodis TaxID=117903 RepID=A0A3S5ADH7_9PLAT|nr:unnamed protein product [Protopolystoma xenopodis]
MDDLFIELNNDCNAVGSATWDFNGHHVAASIYGPDESSIQKSLTHRAYVDVIVTPQFGMHTPRESELEVFLVQLASRLIDVKAFPRSKFTIRITIVAGDSLHPYTVSSACNAISLALMQSGVSMRASIAAVNARFTSNGISPSSTSNDKDIGNVGMLITLCMDITSISAHLTSSRASLLSQDDSILKSDDNLSTGFGVFAMFFGQEYAMGSSNKNINTDSFRSIPHSHNKESPVSPEHLSALFRFSSDFFDSSRDENVPQVSRDGLLSLHKKAYEIANIMIIQLISASSLT